MATNSSTFALALPSDLEIVVTRQFDAPRALVFEVMSTPEHVKRWWGPCSMEMIHCEMDTSVGGVYRFVQRAPDGSEHAFSGVFRELVPPERLVFTFVYEPFPDDGALVTVTLEEVDGRTWMTERIVHRTREGRDGHYNAGMEAGMRETYDRLDALLDALHTEAA